MLRKPISHYRNGTNKCVTAAKLGLPTELFQDKLIPWFPEDAETTSKINCKESGLQCK